MRKISRLLQAVHFNFDNRDRINTLIALLSFWEAKCETQYEESTIEFAEAIKDRILRQRQELDTMRSKRHPTPEKLTVQLVPSNDDASMMLTSAGHNPKLQLTLKSKKTMASIVEHLNTKWTGQNGGPIADHPLRLYVPDKLGHAGYGVESADVTIVSVFHAMNCPAICRLEYNWNPDHLKLGGVLAGHEHQELQSTSDEGSDEHSSDSSVAMRQRSAASSGHSSPSRQSPRASLPPRPVAVNRLAVPDNVRVTGKPLSEDALDDDAIRHGLLLRKASKVTKVTKSASAAASAAAAALASSNKSANAPPVVVASGGPRTRSSSPPTTSNRSTRYSTRSRRVTSTAKGDEEEMIQETGYEMSGSSGRAVSVGNASQEHYGNGRYETSAVGHQGEAMGMASGPSAIPANLDTMSGFMAMDEDLMSEESPLASVGDMYSSDAAVNELDQLEPMPAVEYGFGGSYIDAPFDSEPSHAMSMMASAGSAANMHGRAGAAAHGAHLGVAGLAHQHHATMVVNHHYYQPTWDHSQSYFLGTAPQPAMDPYFASYPASTPHHLPSTSAPAYHDQSQYYGDYATYPAAAHPPQPSNPRPNPSYYQYMK